MTKKFIIAIFAFFILTNPQVTDTLNITDVNFTKELFCLSSNIYHESSGESIEGKKAIAQIVINRTQDAHFPSGICEVVYEKHGKVHQFSWTSNPNKKITDNVTWQECLYIARQALTGHTQHKKLEQTNALFYHADYVHPKWNKKHIITKIGRHIFYTKL
jgi:spore germination cell wall hydrolase CwlJ-like protein